jgi:hypothetical protein
MEQKFGPKLMVADPFSCLKIGRLKATVRRVPHPSMCYDTASNLPTVALRSMAGPTIGISRCDVRNMPTGGPRGFARYATVGRFWRVKD